MKQTKKSKFHPNPKLKLMDQVREVLRYHHYSYRTEQTYCQWILRYIHYFGGKTHPKLLGAKNIEAFLSHLATVDQVTASTQRQALNALVFLYKQVLDLKLEEEITPARSKRSARPPTVMTSARGSSASFRYRRQTGAYGEADLRQRHEIDGMYSPSCSGHRL